MSTTFSIKNYLTKEEAEVVEGRKKEEAEQAENEPQERQIQIVPIGVKRGSEMVAEALITALRQDRETFHEEPQVTNEIYRKVKVITKQDVASNLKEAIEGARGADYLLLETNGEMLGEDEGEFLAYVDTPEKNIYFNMYELLRDFKCKFGAKPLPTEVPTEPVSDIIPGSPRMYEGEMYIVTATAPYKDEVLAYCMLAADKTVWKFINVNDLEKIDEETLFNKIRERQGE